MIASNMIKYVLYNHGLPIILIFNFLKVIHCTTHQHRAEMDSNILKSILNINSAKF